MPGKVDKLKGRAKQAIGRATGNKKLQRKGRRDRVIGEVKDRASKIEKNVERKLDEMLDEREDDRGRGRING